MHPEHESKDHARGNEHSGGGFQCGSTPSKTNMTTHLCCCNPDLPEPSDHHPLQPCNQQCKHRVHGHCCRCHLCLTAAVSSSQLLYELRCEGAGRPGILPGTKVGILAQPPGCRPAGTNRQAGTHPTSSSYQQVPWLLQRRCKASKQTNTADRYRQGWGDTAWLGRNPAQLIWPH